VLKNISTVVFTFLVCHSAYGQGNDPSVDALCSEPTIKLVSEYLNIQELHFGPQDTESRTDSKSSVIASACKRWPYDKSIMIVSFSYDAGIQYEKQLIVSLVDTFKKEAIAAYKGTIPEDAAMTVGSGSLILDTARYDIAPGVRAFGLDLSTSHSQGCGDGGVGPIRTLFVKEGKKIRPVLEGLYLSTWTFIKGGPSCAASEREVVIETTSYGVGILRTVTNGYADLRITATSTFDNGKKSPTRPKRYTLKYDGKSYPVQETIAW